MVVVFFSPHDYIAIKNTCIALDLELTNHLKVEHFICSFSWLSFFSPPQFFIVLCYIFIVPGLLLQLQRQFHSAISNGFSLLKSSMSSYLLCLAIMLCYKRMYFFSKRFPCTFAIANTAEKPQ